MNTIDFSFFVSAKEYYSRLDFNYIDVPWRVSLPTARETIDFVPNRSLLLCDDSVLIGSGEQGFLDLILHGNLPPGSYSTITPCFRGDIISPLHRKEFMKMELIDFKNVSVKRFKEILDFCLKFHQNYLSDVRILYTDTADEISADIISNEIEIGSYGIRTGKHFKWIYATGVALPRLTYAINYEKNRVSSKNN